MSWLAKSIANSLKFDEENTDNNNNSDDNDNNRANNSNPNDNDSESNLQTSQSPKGVKEDLNELTKTLTRQFWGVASFLAPPPPPSDQQPPHPPPPSDPKISEEEPVIGGIKSDFAEISGKFRSGISKLSQNIPVSEFSKMASSFWKMGLEGEEELVGNVVGVTEEVVAFARDLAMHPDTWIEFPVPEDGGFDEFDMSDAQQEHALAVEHLAPRLAALRIELCPGYMSESCFWKIYFILLLPKLNKHDAELLMTPEIAEARAMLSNDLKNRSMEKTETDWSQDSQVHTYNPKEMVDSSHEQHLSGAQTESVALKSSAVESVPSNAQIEPPKHVSSAVESPASSVQTEQVRLISSSVEIDPSTATDSATEKHPVESTEIKIIDKSVIEEEPVYESKKQVLQSGSSSKVVDKKYEDEDDADDWLKDESSEVVGISGTTIPIGNDEDVSFSDLEEDDGDDPSSYKKTTSGSDSSTKDSRDWVQL